MTFFARKLHRRKWTYFRKGIWLEEQRDWHFNKNCALTIFISKFISLMLYLTHKQFVWHPHTHTFLGKHPWTHMRTRTHTQTYVSYSYTLTDNSSFNPKSTSLKHLHGALFSHPPTHSYPSLSHTHSNTRTCTHTRTCTCTHTRTWTHTSFSPDFFLHPAYFLFPLTRPSLIHLTP